MDVTFSTDGGSTYNTLVAASEYDDFGNFAQAPGGPTPTVAETKTFTAVAGVTHIKFTDSTSYGGGFTGIGEIRFGAAPPPPTPGTLIYGK